VEKSQMSFDKFRRGRASQPSGSGKNFEKEPWAKTHFDLEVGDSALIRILKPENEIFDRNAHYWNGFHTCTGDIPVFDGKCCFCFFHKQGQEDYKKRVEAAKRDGKDSSQIAASKFDMAYRRLLTSLEVVDFRYFHPGYDHEKDRPILTPCANPEPQIKRNRGCQGCASNVERIFGGSKVWEVNVAQYQQVNACNDQLGQTCIADISGQFCGREIYLIGFGCEHCGGELLGERDLMEKKQEEINAFVSKPQPCPSCQKEGWPKDMVVSDDTCPKCQGMEPVRGSVFDKNLQVTAVAASRGKGKAFNFDRSAPFSSVAEDLLAHVAEDEIEKLLTPRDLNHFYRPEWVSREKFESDEAYVKAVLDKQADRLREKNPFSSVQAATGSGNRSFGAGRFRR
jgi:hypothetical protein